MLHCRQPFIRQKSNEEITNPSLLHEILPTLGELLSFHDIEVQVAAAEALRVFATGACKTMALKSVAGFDSGYLVGFGFAE